MPSPAPVPPAPSARAQALTPEEFQRIARKVHGLTGIVLKPQKSVMVFARLSKRLNQLNFPTVGAYLDYLDSGDSGDETTKFCNALTTNLTSFFREAHHFEALRKDLARPHPGQDAARLRLWSCGCSTGEEPYSIAMTVLSSPAAAAIPDRKLLATDIDTDVLAKARAGRYDLSRCGDIPDPDRTAFTRLDDDGKTLEFADGVKQMIFYKQLNMLDEWPLRGLFDYIFCRNVLIYFDSETKHRLMDRFARQLRVGGMLFIGHSETLIEGNPLLRSEGKTTYRRVS